MSYLTKKKHGLVDKRNNGKWASPTIKIFSEKPINMVSPPVRFGFKNIGV